MIVHISTGQIHETLNTTYDQYRADDIKTKRFKSQEIYEELSKYQNSSLIEVEEVSRSMGDKPIYLVELGKGDTKVFLWSQMHGNESTATMALMDILRFLSADDQLNDLRNLILSQIKIFMIPLLNPDGGDRFERRNNLGVDLNRDAVRLQTPEAKILMETRNRIHADFGFNLHDQSRRNGVGRTGKPASISFLAPAFNYEKEMNENREDAMRVISVMINTLNQYIPGQIGKYSDDFEPRAFGDNFQKLGTRTILIESGYTYNDDEKQHLRKMNYLSIMEALNAIATSSFHDVPTAAYDQLPFNSGNMADLVIRNIDYPLDGKRYLIDIAFERNEVKDQSGNVHYVRRISDIGDLSTTYGYIELDADNLELNWGEAYKKVLDSSAKLTSQRINNLVTQGIQTVFVRTLSEQDKFKNMDQIRILGKVGEVNKGLDYGSNPSFYFLKGTELKYYICNGKAWKIEGESMHEIKEE
jgi:hypothetical protein